MFSRPNNKVWGDFYNANIERVFNALSGEGDALLKSKVKKLFNIDTVDIAYDCMNAELDAPATVIRHGDA